MCYCTFLKSRKQLAPPPVQKRKELIPPNAHFELHVSKENKQTNKQAYTSIMPCKIWY